MTSNLLRRIIKKTYLLKLSANNKRFYYNNIDDDLLEQDVQQISNQFIIDGIHKIHIIQPDAKEKNTNANLQLKEAISLVKTLPGWKVTAADTFRLRKLCGKSIFGKGNFEEMIDSIKLNNHRSTAIFMNIQMLTPIQLQYLTERFNKIVFDRYQIILKIFQCHARTKEAKLQISLAQIPLLRAKLKFGVEDLDISYDQLNEKEARIRKSLDRIKNHRKFIKKERIKREIPIVAVVGYTNAGKTSLIRALTKNTKLQPEDKLFATIDVTTHPCQLANKLNVLLTDTVGFISNIPTTLVEPFSATLEDINAADAIIHVRDISHPDSYYQKLNVEKTLLKLNVSENVRSNLIEVCNKEDLLNEDEREKIKETSTGILTSVANGNGIKNLSRIIGEVILKTTQRNLRKFRLKNGGVIYQHLMSENVIIDTKVDENDCDKLIITTALTDRQLSMLNSKFRRETITK